MCDGSTTYAPIVRRLAIVMAMRAEAAPVVAALGAVEREARPPLVTEWFAASRQGAEILIAVNGVDRRFGVDSIGTDAATLTTYSVIESFAPELVVSAGTAGGWERSGAVIGDVYLSDGCVVHHDRRIDLHGFAEYGIGRYPVVPTRHLAATLGCKSGVVTTGNSLDESDDDRRAILASGAVAKDMEAASVAYVCEQMGVPFLAVKAVTDLVDHHTATAEQFTANLERAVERLVSVLVDLVDWCAGHDVDDFG